MYFIRRRRRRSLAQDGLDVNDRQKKERKKENRVQSSFENN